jgi:N-acetylmuramoyl-L-alanine amidase
LRRAVCLLLFVLLLLPTSVGLAGNGTAADNKQAGMVLAAKTDDASTDQPDVIPDNPQLTQLRWAPHIDAVTGARSIRIVLDAEGPVQVDGKQLLSPTPRLFITVAGAGAGNLERSVKVDSDIVDGIRIKLVDAKNCQIVVDLPLVVEDSDFKVFSLKKDKVTGKPYRVVIDINRPIPPVQFNFTPGLKGKVIAIDPGHGGSDPGAIGLARTQEKDITLAISLKVKDLLEQAGATVLMTRVTDKDVYGPGASDVDELKARTTVANAGKADIFLSIHINSFVNRTVGGTATYYYQKTSYDGLLAQCLQKNVAANDGLENRGKLPANFYVIKHTAMPASLLEVAFISNPDEENLLNDPQFEQKVAAGVVQGMDEFFTRAAGGERNASPE